MHHIDPTGVLARKGRYAILAKSQELQLRDGSLTKLHMVQEQGQPEASRFLRAIANDVAGTFVFDVRNLASNLDAEIRQLPARDSIGLVGITLRLEYPTAAVLRCKIIEEALASFRDAFGSQPEALAA